MSDDRYTGGGTRGGKAGCAAAAVVGGPLLLFLNLLFALGDCMPDAPCHHGTPLKALLLTALIAAPVGLLVRWTVNRFVRRN